MSPRRLAVIIVHYKTPAMLRECIATLLPDLNTSTDEVFIIDNASGESDVVPLRPLASAPGITLIESPENLGFAGANNLAIRRILHSGGADYFLLLNPDTLIRPGAVPTLLQFLQAHPHAAAVGPRLEFPDGSPQQSAFGPITPISEFIRGASIGPVSRLLKRWQVYGAISHQPHQAHWLSGACVLLRSSLIESVGLLDDRFFMYFEEVDFFRRAAQSGRGTLQIWYQPAARVVHLVGQSSGVTRSAAAAHRKRLPDYWFQSRHYYFRKHFGYRGMLAADLFWFAGHMLNRIRQCFTGVSHAAVAQAETRDLLRHSVRQLLHPRRGTLT